MAAQSGIKIVMASHDLGRCAGSRATSFFWSAARCASRARPPIFDHPTTPEAAAFLRGDLGDLIGRKGSTPCASRFSLLALQFCPAPSPLSQPPALRIDRSSWRRHVDPGFRAVRYLLRSFKAKTGIEVRVIAQGTGQRWTPRGAATPTWCSFPRQIEEEKFLAEVLA